MKFLELIVNYRVNLPAEAEIDLASTIRGVWGRALRKSNCLQRNIECRDCPFDNCNYYTLFEKKYVGAGQYHPYIIQPLELEGNRLSVVFKFIGWVCDNPGQLLLSIINTDGGRIFSRGRAYDLKLFSITDRQGSILFKYDARDIFSPQVENLEFAPSGPASFSLVFDTPLRQKSAGKLMQKFDWESFAKSLIMRIRYLDEFFNQRQLGLPQRVELDCERVVDVSLKWRERIRKSFRQEAVMSLGGLTGELQVKNAGSDMAAILKLGSILHAGKQCSFGNGHYHLREI